MNQKAKNQAFPDAVSLDWDFGESDWSSKESKTVSDNTEQINISPVKAKSRTERRKKQQKRSCTRTASYSPNVITSTSKYHR